MVIRRRKRQERPKTSGMPKNWAGFLNYLQRISAEPSWISLQCKSHWGNSKTHSPFLFLEVCPDDVSVPFFLAPSTAGGLKGSWPAHTSIEGPRNKAFRESTWRRRVLSQEAWSAGPPFCLGRHSERKTPLTLALSRCLRISPQISDPREASYPLAEIPS